MNKKARSILLIVAGVFAGVAVAYINFLIISSWFGKAGPANLGSIEVSYVSMGRFLRDFGFRSWAPFWYLGFPFHLFYTPLLPFLEFVLNSIAGLHLWESYRLVTGIAYILVPVSIFLFGWQLSRKLIGGLIAALLYSVGPSILYFIIPEIAGDSFSQDFLDPRRFTILVRWGEGPHTLSLVFLPLAGLFFARVLMAKKTKFLDILLTSLFIGAAALSNALGFFGTLILIFSLAFAKFAQKPKLKKRVLVSTVFVSLLAVGLISFWYNLSFIANFFGEGGGIFKRYLELFPWGWLVILLVFFVVLALIKRLIKNFGVASALVWFLILFSVVAVYYLSAPSEFSERRIELLPQALRYGTQVDMSAAILIGVSVGALFSLLEKKIKVLWIFEVILAITVIAVSYIYVQPYLPTAKQASSTFVDLDTTREKEIADWLKSRVDVKKGERVFIPGNYGFYLNWYSDVWQHRGALFQAATHPWPEHIHYQMANGENEEISTAWLKAINAKYAVITVPGSQELYKEIKNFERFAGLEPVYQEKQDIIYEVPLKRPSVAKSVSLSIMNSLSVPEKADSKKELLSYVDWVENSSKGELAFEVQNNDTYRINGPIEEGEGVLVQMTYDSGWKASDRGKRVPKEKDPLGFLVLKPAPGNVDITLSHHSTWKQWLGFLTTIGVFVFIIWFAQIPKGKKKKTKPDSPKLVS